MIALRERISAASMNPAERRIMMKRLKFVSLLKFSTPRSRSKERSAIASSKVFISKLRPESRLTKSERRPRSNSLVKRLM